MLLTVLILSGTVIGATAIAGLLMRYQIRQTTNVVNSAKAIFAADSGLECQFYRRFQDPTSADYCQTVSLSNQSGFTTSVTEEGGQIIIRSVGEAGDVARAFEASFNE